MTEIDPHDDIEVFIGVNVGKTSHHAVVATARDAGIFVAYLPGLAMRRIADLHAGAA